MGGPLNRASVWDGLIYGESRFPLDSVSVGEGPSAPYPEAKRLVDRISLVIDWNENYTDEHVRLIAAMLVYTGVIDGLPTSPYNFGADRYYGTPQEA